MSPLAYLLTGFLPGLLPNFSYISISLLVMVSAEWKIRACIDSLPESYNKPEVLWLFPFHRWENRGLANLRALSSPTQLLSGGIERGSWVILPQSSVWVALPLACWLNLADFYGHLDTTLPQKALLVGFPLLLNVFILHLAFIHSQHLSSITPPPKLVFLSVSPDSLRGPRVDPTCPLALYPTVPKKPGVRPLHRAFGMVNSAPHFLSMPCQWRPSATHCAGEG